MSPKSETELLSMFKQHDVSTIRKITEDFLQSKLNEDLKASSVMLNTIFENIRTVASQGKTSHTVKFEGGTFVTHVINTLKMLGFTLATDYDAGRTVIVIKWEEQKTTLRR